MTKLRASLSGLLALALLIAVPVSAQVDTGSADFSRFVALGDSLSQGFSNGGLVRGVQRNSIPALIARQAGVAGFEQPLVSEPGIPPLLRIQALAPQPVIVPRPGAGVPVNLNLPRPYDNLAVSGFDTRDAIVTRTGNPIIDITLRGLGTALEQAVFLQPTFALVWLGSNDALGAATSGIVIDGVTLTPVSSFQADYQAVLGAMASTGANLVVATVPDVTTIPFVNTVPPVVVDPATSEPVLGPDGQPIPLIGPDGPLNPATDKVLLTATAELAQGRGLPPQLGGTGPLSDSAVLSGNEINRITNRINAFNQVIRSVAGQVGAPVFDANTFLREVAAEGVIVGGVELTVDFLTGGLFSYDGVHPTPLGYAVIANQLIETINEGYGAAIPPVDLLPFVFGPDGAGGAVLPGNVQAGEVVYSEAADASMRSTLGIPSREKLEEMKQEGSGSTGPYPVVPGKPISMPVDRPIFQP